MNHHTQQPQDGDDDAEAWEPLHMQNHHHRQNQSPVTTHSTADMSSTKLSTRQVSHNKEQQRRQERLQQIERQLDTRICLKRGLVDHPVQLFWRRLAVHCGAELWHLDRTVKISLLLMAVGASLYYCALLAMLLSWPGQLATVVGALSRFLLVGVLLLAGYLYLFPTTTKVSLEDLISYGCTPHFFRHVSMVFLWILPTALEVAALHFLSSSAACQWWHLLYTTLLVSGVALVNRQQPPRNITHICYLALYMAALTSTWIGWYHQATHSTASLLLLTAPFVWATGVLLLLQHSDHDWLARSLRHALRLTLAEVLQTVRSSVQQDELLQLAMLRWIVDYWSSDNNNAPSSRRGKSSSTAIVPVRRELQWDELSTMLRMTTDQLAWEVQSLQPQVDTTHPSFPVDARPDAPAGSSPPQTNVPSSADAGAFNNNNPLYDLQSMLASMDVDEHAKPAVEAYKRSVDGFPPSVHWAILISVTRRCPATLVLLGYVLAGWHNLLTGFILVPFIVLEYLRVQSWARSLHDNSNQKWWAALEKIDSMTLLLSNDSPQQPATLLAVWTNVTDSVHALEASLTAARCVQTTAVAVDFCGNILSLAQFGMEVSRHGWWHGLGVLVRECLFLDDASAHRRRGSYTYAAQSAFRNGQTLNRNVRVLHEQDMGHVVRPILAIIPAIVGYGWLWGTVAVQDPPLATGSTVEIEQLDDDVADDEMGPLSAPTLNKNASEPTTERVASVAAATERVTPVEETSSQSNLPELALETPDGNPGASAGKAIAPVTTEPQTSVSLHKSVQEDTTAEILDLLASCDEKGCLSTVCLVICIATITFVFFSHFKFCRKCSRKRRKCFGNFQSWIIAMSPKWSFTIA